MRGIVLYRNFGLRWAHSLVVLLCSVAISPAIAQQVTLSVGSGSAIPGSVAALDISMAASGVSVAGLQWILNYPSDVTGVSVVASPATTAAGKILSCTGGNGSTSCILYGLTGSTLSNGSVATATFTISTASVGPVIPITLSGMVATTGAANTIPMSGTGGTINVIQAPPTLSRLSCSPTSVNAPGSAACTVTLSKAAPTGGFAVALASNNANATVPATVTVAPGAATAGFTVSVASITSNQPAVVTASANGASMTASLSLVAAPQLSTLSCIPSTLGTGQATVCTVTLSKSATSPATISLSSNSSVLPAPTNLTISTGSSSGTFTATAGTVSRGFLGNTDCDFRGSKH